MKIAVFHNYMDNIGGAERVVLTLAKHLNADLYSTVANENSIKKHRLLKTIRFMKEPSFESLIDQLGVLNKSNHKIINHLNHMDLTFQKP